MAQKKSTMSSRHSFTSSKPMLVSTYILPYKPRKIESQQIKNKKLELLTCIARHITSDNEYFNKIYE